MSSSDYIPTIAAVAALGLAGAVYLKTRGSGPVRPQFAPSTADELSRYGDGKPVFAIEPNGKMPIRLAKSGVASLPPLTIPEIFKRAAAAGGDNEALRWEDPVSKEWKVWSWSQYFSEAEKTARAFIHLGLQQFESVNIIGFNSPEWFFANVGVILAGGKAAGIYTTNGPEACQYISEHSEARIVVVENEGQLKKFLAVWDSLPRLRAIVVYQPETGESVNAKHKNGNVYSWDKFITLGDAVPAAELQRRYDAQDPGHCCLLIYTSGTTGPPKAVMISHDNIFFTAHTLVGRIGSFGEQPEAVVSYLPLSHIAAQMIDVWLPMFLTANRSSYVTVWFARPDALKGSLGATLRAARPTFFFGVPRVWEKMMETIKAVGAKNTGLKKKISAWARATGAAYWKEREVGGSGAIPLSYGLAKTIAFSKVRAAIGLDRCSLQFVGAAPMAREVFEFFASLDVPVFEIYGMSECTGPETVTFPGAYRLGATGMALGGTEIKIDHVAGRDKPGEGEICYRGRHIMMGYMKQLEKTRETIDPDGFLHSGDVGRLDSDGFLSITGRIKELIITAGGENIAPVPIENAIKAACPALSNVMMVGDRRKYNVCLVTLKAEVDEHGMPGNKLIAEAKAVSSSTTIEEAQKDAAWQKYIHGGIDHYNKNAVSQAQRIQKFAILPRDFSLAHELTPTLKLKRDVAAERYKAVIEKLYEE